MKRSKCSMYVLTKRTYRLYCPFKKSVRKHNRRKQEPVLGRERNPLTSAVNLETDIHETILKSTDHIAHTIPTIEYIGSSTANDIQSNLNFESNALE